MCIYYMYTYTYIYTHIYIDIYIYMYRYVYTCRYMYNFVYVYIYKYVYTHMYSYFHMPAGFNDLSLNIVRRWRSCMFHASRELRSYREPRSYNRSYNKVAQIAKSRSSVVLYTQCTVCYYSSFKGLNCYDPG